MSWDPNQPQGQPQQGQPMQNPYSGYGTPPPAQNPYEQPSGYTMPPYQEGMAYAAFAPQAPRPLGQAIQKLPNQYIKVTTKPGAQSFAEEQGKASWDIIWVQLAFITAVAVIIGLLSQALGAAMLSSLASAGGSTATMFTMLSLLGGGATSLYSIITVPLFFFIGVGVQYLLAKAFGGTGLFKTQMYSNLLYQVPIGIISYIIALIPVLGGIVAFALWVYAQVLNVFMIMSTHRLSGGKATAVVLIPIGAVFLLSILCAIAFVAFFVSLLPH